MNIIEKYENGGVRLYYDNGTRVCGILFNDIDDAWAWLDKAAQ